MGPIFVVSYATQNKSNEKIICWHQLLRHKWAFSRLSTTVLHKCGHTTHPFLASIFTPLGHTDFFETYLTWKLILQGVKWHSFRWWYLKLNQIILLDRGDKTKMYGFVMMALFETIWWVIFCKNERIVVFRLFQFLYIM